MKFSEKLAKIFQRKHLLEKAKKGKLTQQDWKVIRTEYKKEFGTDLDADRAAESGNPEAASANSQALAIVNKFLAENEIPVPGGASAESSLIAGVTAITDAVGQMMGRMLPDNSIPVSGRNLNVNGPGTTEQHLFGIAHDWFSTKARFNRIAINPAIATTEPVDEKTHGETFRRTLEKYSKKVSGRINFHRQNGTLNHKALSEGLDVDLHGNGGLGDQYMVIRIDQLIARLLSVKNVYDIFPRRYGLQDRELMTNAFFGDFSQAYQEGPIWKGRIDLEPEVAYVDDSMMKTLFKSMKWLEREYIGYLNRDGSDPIKWSMIEWALLNISTKLILEQNERKILGVYLKPEANVPGHFLNAGTGVFYTLMRYYNEGKMALMDDPAFAAYDSGVTFVSLVQAMYQELAMKVSDLDTDYEVILNANHRAMWKAGIREIFGKDTDFTGPNGDVIPDTQVPIRWCPYFKQMPIVLFQKPGNIQCLEFEPGEMHKISFDTEMEAVKVWSVWKEGTSAAYVGRPFGTKAAAKANDFKEQQIFMNKPAVTLEPNEANVTVRGDIRIYITGKNTGGGAIDDIVGAKQGVAYMIEAGPDISYLPQIPKQGKFDTITADFAPTQEGDYILVAARDEAVSKFYELERCVDGVRTINREIQPNVYGNGGR